MKRRIGVQSMTLAEGDLVTVVRSVGFVILAAMTGVSLIAALLVYVDPLRFSLGGQAARPFFALVRIVLSVAPLVVAVCALVLLRRAHERLGFIAEEIAALRAMVDRRP